MDSGTRRRARSAMLPLVAALALPFTVSLGGAPAARATPAPAPAGRTLDLADLGTGRAPAVPYLVGQRVITGTGHAVPLGLPPGSVEPTLLGRRHGELILRVARPDGDLASDEGIVGVRAGHPARRIVDYTDARELFEPYLLPGRPTLLLLADGSDSYNPVAEQVSLRTGRQVHRTWYPYDYSSLVHLLGLGQHGAYVEVRDRLVRWGVSGKRSMLLDDREHADQRSLSFVSEQADLVGFRTEQGTEQGTEFRRLSAPAVTVWTGGAGPADPSSGPLAVSPDGRRLVIRESGRLVVRRTGDGAVLSSVRLTDGARRVRLGQAVFETDRAYLVEVRRTSNTDAGVLRCTVGGRCAYAVPARVDAHLPRF